MLIILRATNWAVPLFSEGQLWYEKLYNDMITIQRQKSIVSSGWNRNKKPTSVVGNITDTSNISGRNLSNISEGNLSDISWGIYRIPQSGCMKNRR